MAGRFTFVQGDIADPEVVGPLVDASDAVLNFAAESHVDRSILDPEAFLATGVIGVHVLLDACRAAPAPAALPAGLDRRGLRLRGRGPRRGGRPARTALPVRGGQGGRRAARPELRHHPRARRGRDPRLEHLRAVPPSREAHPAVRHQRARRPAAADVRRRPPATRMAVRVRPRRGDRLRPPQRRLGRDLQRGRRHRAHEPRGRDAPPRPAREAVVAGPNGRRPARPRPPVRDGRHEARDARLAPDDDASRTAWPRPSPGTRRNEAWWRAARSGDWDGWYDRQYGQRLATGQAAPAMPATGD